MHVRWKKVRLQSNRQTGERACPHRKVKQPSTLTPLLMVYERGKYRTLHRIGPSIRECCIRGHSELALASFWTEVERRFVMLESSLNAEDLKDLLKLKEQILRAIEVVVPRVHHMKREVYANWAKAGKYPERYRARRVQVQPQNEGTLEEWCALLGVNVTVTYAELKTTWRKLAMKHHPDRGGDSGEFIKYQSAYEKIRVVVEARG